MPCELFIQKMGCRAGLYNMLLLNLYSVFISTEGACPSGWTWNTRVSGVCYKILPTSRTYHEQKNVCRRENGHLASIHSQNEINAIKSLLQPSSGSYYIGLNDISVDRRWVYSDSTPYDFSNWEEGEPNHLDDEDCVEMKTDGRWNDIPCSRSFKGICKREEPCDLPDIQSSALGTTPTSRTYESGSSVNYYCAEGFTLLGSSTARCSSGAWQPSTVPHCKAKPCSLPVIESNALEISVITEEYESGSSINYYCAEGYVINGSSSAVCLYGEWIPPTPPECEAKPCSLPVIESNALEISVITEEYESGSSINYYCAEGYVINGSSSAVCLYGEWIPPTPPECEAQPCSLPFIKGTAIKFNATKKQYENGSSIDYYCAEGYVINGSSSAVCLYGDWIPSNIPGCQEAVEQEEGIAGVPSPFVIGILCLLAIAVIICIVAYKLKKGSKCHQAPETKCGPNESFAMHNIYHKNTLKSVDEFSRNKLNLLERIYSGLFGPVYRATAVGLFRQHEETTVQIVFLEDNSTEVNKMNFRSMVETYGSMKLHPNVLSFYGYSFSSDPMFLILEYPVGGNLKEYLQNRMGDMTQRLPDSELITFALQIIMGLDYISSRNCVHMDLKASKVLLNHDLVCKISDFRPVPKSAAVSNIYSTSVEVSTLCTSLKSIFLLKIL
ncbi:Complement factor H [Holothuria leucospilota]|uniref:Complement factor H n=1 Tax=Holothuria leucospilota TaxID=206669 RepID=A0A9Q1CCD9_HOLLE|nr:Complement factor H [Holothuria leucospilota]